MAKEIAVGTEVADHTGSYYTYGGPNEHGSGWFSLKFDLLEGTTVATCDTADVMPAADVPVLDLKDSRITVGNYKETKPRSAPGPWQATIPLADGGDWGGWFKTKRAALTECAMRLQIMDWHNA